LNIIYLSYLEFPALPKAIAKKHEVYDVRFDPIAIGDKPVIG